MLLSRLSRLARFDLDVLDEVRIDPRATRSSVAVAVASMLLLGLGGWLSWSGAGIFSSGAAFLDGGSELFVKSVLLGSLFGVALWLAWLLIVYGLLQRLAGVTVRIDELLRAGGLATAPLALGVLMALPAVSLGVGVLALGAWLVTMQAAVERCAPRAGAVAGLANLAGFGAWVLAMSLLATASDPLAPGPFIADALLDAIRR